MSDCRICERESVRIDDDGETRECHACGVETCDECGWWAEDAGWQCHWCDDDLLRAAPIPDVSKAYRARPRPVSEVSA